MCDKVFYYSSLLKSRVIYFGRLWFWSVPVMFFFVDFGWQVGLVFLFLRVVLKSFDLLFIFPIIFHWFTPIESLSSNS